jgi:hypothetical protein
LAFQNYNSNFEQEVAKTLLGGEGEGERERERESNLLIAAFL